MSYDVLIEKNAIKEIKKFPAPDIQRIKEAIKKLPDFPARMDVKKLAGTRNIYRIRTGHYRILIELEVHTVKVFAVFHRKKAYK
ncbi:MAG: type II toxin-antitoxin system RelE/ParE family toxin [Methanosarcinales archaeon]|jgi:mRNA interferase RelE/StbE|nr:type II toxin-antitoxin system RelE/ParE family toxin [Methanosarcinales archaeon]